MPRFVVLEHSGFPDPARATHWDLMLETPEGLATWCLPNPPAPGIAEPLQSLPLHRAAYLDYEGPVSGGRGHVTRWDAGTYELHAQTPNRWELSMAGLRLRGIVVLEQTDNAWRMLWDASESGDSN